MSDRPQSTPQYVTPPLLDPATWEDHQGFRESFLVQFLDPWDNFVLREAVRQPSESAQVAAKRPVGALHVRGADPRPG